MTRTSIFLSYICIVRDVAGNTVNGYVNGKLLKARTTNWVPPSVSNEPLPIGKSYAGAFKGAMDATMIFNTARTPWPGELPLPGSARIATE